MLKRAEKARNRVTNLDGFGATIVQSKQSHAVQKKETKESNNKSEKFPSKETKQGNFGEHTREEGSERRQSRRKPRTK
jgi:hypothetical protein